jgi:hypothetical protein
MSAAEGKSTYLDVGRCWRAIGKTDLFRGAVAVFATRTGPEAVLFTAQCDVGPSLEEMTSSFRVRVRCIDGIEGLALCNEHRPAELDPQTFSPGVRPEFPVQLFVFEGVLRGPPENRAGALVFPRLTVSRSQSIPREMFGAFILDPPLRKEQIQNYLMHGAYNKEGYKQLL